MTTPHCEDEKGENSENEKLNLATDLKTHIYQKTQSRKLPILIFTLLICLSFIILLSVFYQNDVQQSKDVYDSPIPFLSESSYQILGDMVYKHVTILHEIENRWNTEWTFHRTMFNSNRDDKTSIAKITHDDDNSDEINSDLFVTVPFSHMTELLSITNNSMLNSIKSMLCMHFIVDTLVSMLSSEEDGYHESYRSNIINNIPSKRMFIHSTNRLLGLRRDIYKTLFMHPDKPSLPPEIEQFIETDTKTQFSWNEVFTKTDVYNEDSLIVQEKVDIVLEPFGHILQDMFLLTSSVKPMIPTPPDDYTFFMIDFSTKDENRNVPVSISLTLPNLVIYNYTNNFNNHIIKRAQTDREPLSPTSSTKPIQDLDVVNYDMEKNSHITGIESIQTSFTDEIMMDMKRLINANEIYKQKIKENVFKTTTFPREWSKKVTLKFIPFTTELYAGTDKQYVYVGNVKYYSKEIINSNNKNVEAEINSMSEKNAIFFPINDNRQNVIEELFLKCPFSTDIVENVMRNFVLKKFSYTNGLLPKNIFYTSNHNLKSVTSLHTDQIETLPIEIHLSCFSDFNTDDGFTSNGWVIEKQTNIQLNDFNIYMFVCWSNNPLSLSNYISEKNIHFVKTYGNDTQTDNSLLSSFIALCENMKNENRSTILDGDNSFTILKASTTLIQHNMYIKCKNESHKKCSPLPPFALNWSPDFKKWVIKADD